MMFPLVQELAAEKVPVRLICGTLGFSRQAYYKWLAHPISDRDWGDAHTINALVDAHRDDPEFGYRFLADELANSGRVTGERRVWRLCSQQKLWSTTTKKGRRGAGKTPDPAVHDDLVERRFAAAAPNLLWLTDITEHPIAWIPAVVATPTGGGGDAGSEVHAGTKGDVLRSDRPGRHRQSSFEGGRGARGCLLHMEIELKRASAYFAKENVLPK